MASGKISYDAGQHKALEAELKKIGDNFEDLITELGNLQSSVDDNLEGEAATSLSSEIASLLSKLETENTNWSTVSTNANNVEKLIKEADNKAKQTVEGSGG
ncbi:peptidase [Streptococcus pantholopis]|uniref:Peptidase n=1 Tax=Streptococcus pantholopis TaxID=1811193 RepID=A0A172Q9A2_9STRE|nr:peptidase [Streptococcus pantholopis]AND80012.1 peptidase [Streptococcus pantholopis]